MGLAAVFVLSACDYNSPEDYDPKRDYVKYLENKIKTLESDLESAKSGTNASPVDRNKLALDAAAKKYATFCSACHGADGKANSAAAAMNPPPRNLTDAAWQDSVSDERIYRLAEGGAAVGIGSTMPAWGAAISEETSKTWLPTFGISGNNIALWTVERRIFSLT